MGAGMKGSIAGLSGPLALVLLLPMEAGVPIPVPADLVMFTVGERVAAGKIPLWLGGGHLGGLALLRAPPPVVGGRGRRPADHRAVRAAPRAHRGAAAPGRGICRDPGEARARAGPRDA